MNFFIPLGPVVKSVISVLGFFLNLTGKWMGGYTSVISFPFLKRETALLK